MFREELGGGLGEVGSGKGLVPSRGDAWEAEHEVEAGAEEEGFDGGEGGVYFWVGWGGCPWDC